MSKNSKHLRSRQRARYGGGLTSAPLLGESSRSVSDIVMPPLGLVIRKVDFSSLFLNISGTSYPTLAQTKAAGAATINYGVFLNTVLDFLIVALVIFLLVRQVNRPGKPRQQPRQQQGMPVLRFGDSSEGNTLPGLHVGSARHLVLALFVPVD